MSSMYNTGMQTYRKLLEQRMQTVAWNISFWQAFMGFIGGKKSMFDSVTPHGVKGPQKATGQPIEVLQNFRHEGGISMDIPIFYPLTGRGVSGNVQLQGKGERPKLATMEVNINQQRHAYLQQDNKMSKQVLQSPAMVKQLMRRANEYLGDWFARWNSFQPYLAFLEGYSENLTKTAANGGLGKSKQSHMNIYSAGAGRVTFSNTLATYEASVAAAVTGLTNTPSDYFSTTVIENLVYAASHNHRVTPLDVNGMKLYPVVISDAAAKQLQADADFNDRLQLAAERGLEKNPLFTGKVAGIYGGALLIIDETVPSVYKTGDSEFGQARSTVPANTTGVCYGSQDANSEGDFMANPVDAGAVKPAILFGKSAIALGVANDLSFETEDYDFKQKIEIGADMICGFQRSDILDTDGYFGLSGDKRKENVSSVVALTYSPSDASW